MNCKFCFGKINKGLDTGNKTETFKSICKITKSVNLVGGEPFTNITLLKSLVEIGVSNRMNISIMTNGLILTNNLDNPEVKYILSHVKMIGISVDSFSEETNRKIGRISNNNCLVLEKVIQLRKMCDEYRTKLKINTVVSKLNLNEELGMCMEVASPDKWKLLQVVTSNPMFKITDEEFQAFVSKNKYNDNVVIENEESINLSYLMVNSFGDLYINQSTPTNINVNNVVSNDPKEPANEFSQLLDSTCFNKELYAKRYCSSTDEIFFNKNKYKKALGNRFSGKGNVLFLDVESITLREYENKKYPGLSTNQMHLLYCAIEVDSNMHIISRYTDHLQLGIDIASCLDKGEKNPYGLFYKRFCDIVLNGKIKQILVSGTETERNFLMDCIYYNEELSRRDYDKLQNFIIGLVDIHSIIEKEILSYSSKKSASRTVLSYLRQYRPDLFYYTRKEYKDSNSSWSISNQLLSMYHKMTNMAYALSNKTIKDIENYCFDDVYDDFELVYAYELLNKSSIHSRKEIESDERETQTTIQSFS